MTFKIATLSREEITFSLKLLKEYRNALKQIGNRASLSDIAFPKVHIRVEYAPHASMDHAKKMVESLFGRFFQDISYVAETTEFTENPKLSGGIRLFAGDEMMDISFDRFLPILNQ